MQIDNSTFFTSYNHLYHFHQATLLNYFYQNPQKYFDEILNPIYTDQERDSFFFDKDEVYFKKAIVLDMRSTYLHCVETLFNLLGVFKKEGEVHYAKKTWINAFAELTEYSPQQLYKEILSYGQDPSTLNYLTEPIPGSDWSYGRYIFYFGMNPPSDKVDEFVQAVQDSSKAVKLALEMFAIDFGDRKEYDSYKHGLRVLDALKQFYFLDPKTKGMFVVDAENSLTFPRKSRSSVEVKTQNVDFVRDYRMCVLGARLIQMIINQRRLVYHKDKMDFEQVPIVMLSEKSVRWHGEHHVGNRASVIKLEDFEKKFGFKVNLPSESSDSTSDVND